VTDLSEDRKAKQSMVLLKSMKITDSFTACDLNIKYDEETGILYVKWTGEVTLQKLKEGFRMALDYSRAYNANKWLLDLSERTVLPEAFKKWVNRCFLHQILRTNKRNCFVAGVLPVNYYCNVQDWFDSSELIGEDYLLLFNHFLLPEAGTRWLNSMS
jgi:hypothetical protein